MHKGLVAMKCKREHSKTILGLPITTLVFLIKWFFDIKNKDVGVWWCWICGQGGNGKWE